MSANRRFISLPPDSYLLIKNLAADAKIPMARFVSELAEYYGSDYVKSLKANK